MYEILNEYIKAHPCMEPRDLIKFCYQSVMGPGHMAPTRQMAAQYAAEERAAYGPRGRGEPMVQPLEGLAARVDVDCGISPKSLGGLFCLTADTWQGGDAGCVLEMISHLQDSAALPFGKDQMEQCLLDWRRGGCIAVSHSQRYKEHYRAHYRLVMKSFLPYFKAIKAIEALPKGSVVAVDGMCGSGKSTMAGVLGDIFQGTVIHMDDFFLPFEMKTPERMSQPGGNVHYERFSQEVAAKLKSRLPFEYGVYDCSVGEIAGRRLVPPSDIIIIEGSYCLNPHIRDIYDLKIFVETDDAVQTERIVGREGQEGLEMFTSRWIPLENHYFTVLGIKDKCDIVVRT